MNNLKVATRMLLLIGLLSALLVGVGALGLWGISQSNAAMKSVYQDRTVPAEMLGEMRALQLTNRLSFNIALVTPTPAKIAEMVGQIEANSVQFDKAWNAYAATNATPAEREIAKAFVEDRKTYLREGLVPALAALRANDLVEVKRVLVERIRPLDPLIERSIDALAKMQIDDARAAYDASTVDSATIRRVSLLAIAGGLLFAGVYGFTTVRSISGQLGGEPGEAARLAQGAAAGDLGVPIRVRIGDTTSLMAQLKTMQESLVRVVGTVRRNSESVATASVQISQGNNDLSSRTEEQAAALQKTAASMEALSSTVKRNADSAVQANLLALSASAVALRGGAVVGEVVATMRGINDSSRRIADIIGVIDDIAFQTNILALNAAVEAARAGEQGRGFAVVAAEVRTLAGRSADAAREIKSLITASVERVERGTTLVDQAGTTMTEVVASIQRVADIVAEISIASAEQSAGVAQVGAAICQMDQATQQNAALVEEGAAAAESLKQQAQQLVEGVAVFRLAPDGMRADTATRAFLPAPSA